VDFNLPSNWWVSRLHKSEFAVLDLGFEKLGLGLDNRGRTTKNAYCCIYSLWFKVSPVYCKHPPSHHSLPSPSLTQLWNWEVTGWTDGWFIGIAKQVIGETSGEVGRDKMSRSIWVPYAIMTINELNDPIAVEWAEGTYAVKCLKSLTVSASHCARSRNVLLMLGSTVAVWKLSPVFTV
jgi:hypothetical protein